MKHISEFVRQCTDALSSDPEVQLEIEQELRDHLECRAAEEQSNGMSEEASEELAIKSFGDAPEISESLYDTNLYRMKLHAKIRFFMKIAAIPALLIALFFSFDHRNMLLNWNVDELYIINYPSRKIQNNLNADEKLIVYGDLTKQNTGEGQKAIWKRWPENKVYMANYIIGLINEFDILKSKHIVYLRRKAGMPVSKLTLNNMLKELRLAESVEPQNAFYNYMAATVLLKEAALIESKRVKLPGKMKFEFRNDFILKDRKVFDHVMQEIKAGLTKPYCREYAMEMTRLRCDIACGNPKNLKGQLERLAFAASTPLPFLNAYRNIEKAISYNARLQAKAGNKKEAEFYLNAWKSYVKQLNDGADTLIGVLVANAIIKFQSKQIPEIYRMLGEPEKAATAAEELKQAETVINNWKKENKVKASENGKILKQKGGIFANVMLLALGGNITDKMLAPERNLNYIMLEKIVVAVMSLVGLAIIFIILMYMGWNHLRGKHSFIFVPSLTDLVKIIGWGLVTPLVIYFIFTRIPVLSGRDNNIFNNFGLCILQSLFFIFGIPTAMFLTVSNFVRRRCRKTGIDVPPKSKWLTGLIIITQLSIADSLRNVDYVQQQKFLSFTWMFEPTTPVFIVIVEIALLIIALPLFRLMFMKKKYSRYKLTLYVNLIAPIILMMLAVSVIVRPYLDREEIRFVKEDKCIFSEKGFSILETNAIEKLKNELNQELNKLPDKI